MGLAIVLSFWFGGFVVAFCWTIHDLACDPPAVREILQHRPVAFFACLTLVLALWMIVIPVYLAYLPSREGR